MSGGVDALLAAWRAGEPLPRLSEAMDLDLDAAYGLQQQFVAGVSAERYRIGYKGALTAPAAQANLGVDRAVVGVLFDHPGHPQSPPGSLTVDVAAFGNLLLETELSFRVGRNINQPLASPAEAAAAMAGVAPAIELANLFFDGPPKGTDLVAANSAFGSFIRAAEVNLNDVDGVPVRLSRGDEVLHEGSTGEVLGGQYEAVQWLVNAVLELGYEVSEGQILLTGSVGRLQPGVPGSYVADFGEAGEIRFTVH